MVVRALKSLIVLAGLGSFFPETWDSNLILHLALLSLIVEALKSEPRSVWGCLHRVSRGKLKKPRRGVLVIEQSQTPEQYPVGKLLSV